MLSRSIFPVILFFCLVLSVRAQRNYYLDPAATSAGDGSQAHPFHALAELNALRLKGGDRVVFKPGSVIRGSLTPKVDSVFGDGNIFIGTETDSIPATIDGDSAEAIRLVGADNIVVSNLKLKGAGRKGGNHTCGLLAWGCSRTYFLNLDISGFQKAGLGIYGCRMAVANKVDAHDNGAAGIEVGGKEDGRSWNIMIKSCRAWSNPGDPTNFENHSGNGIIVGETNLVEIGDCVAWDNGADMPRVGNGPVGIWAWEADSVEIHHCISFGNHTSKGSSDGGGFDLDGGVTHAHVCRNLSYDNEGSGLGIFQYWGASAWHDNEVAENYSIDDASTTGGAAGILVWSSDTSAANMSGLNLHHNNIVNRKGPLLRYHEDSRHLAFSIHDNTFYGPGPLPTGDSRQDRFANNRWCRSGSGSNKGPSSPLGGIKKERDGCAVPRELEALKNIRDASTWREWLEKN